MTIPECSAACRDFFANAFMYLGIACAGYLLLCLTGVMGLIERHFDRHRSDFSEWEREVDETRTEEKWAVLFDQERGA